MKSCTITMKQHNIDHVIIRPLQFQKLIFHWFDAHGRKHLPWQQDKTPYRVWISEIMLQQTQVNTVIPYYEQFMRRFPDITALANAPEDDVLHAWAGLGYYSRARNLHRAAKMVVHEFGGQFPDTLETLLMLPGIGRSTAAAILSIAFNQSAAILDGNVKRVLARFQGITAAINEKNIEAILWNLAEKYMPKQCTADYTQAMMDLGATLCIRSKPNCPQCPLAKHCIAYQQNLTEFIPQKKSKRKIPIRSAVFLIFQHQGRVLLNKRPAHGIWGSLWSFPEIIGEVNDAFIQAYCRKHFSITFADYTPLKSFRHTFSHYHLDISPIMIAVKRLPRKIADMEDLPQIWYNPNEIGTVGLPKPIQMIMKELR
jgi:A/G-specific adenine glycosylase